jgi:hypothetical protein
MGTGLFITVAIKQSVETMVYTISEKTVEGRRVPGWAPVITDEGAMVSFLTNHMLLFTGGERIPFLHVSCFGFSPGGRYFFLDRGVPSGDAKVFLAHRPLDPLQTLPSGVVPRSIFDSDSEVFVFAYAPLGTNTTRKSERCYIFQKDGLTLDLRKQVDISRFGYVVDMDTSKRVALVDHGRDLLDTWGLLNLDTGTYSPLGHSRGRGLFLTDELAKFLDSDWKP